MSTIVDGNLDVEGDIVTPDTPIVPPITPGDGIIIGGEINTPDIIEPLLPAYLTQGKYNKVNTGNTTIYYTGNRGKIGGTK